MIIYAIIVIAFLVISHLMSYVDVYTDVVISMFKERHVMYCIKQINWPEMFTTIPNSK